MNNATQNLRLLSWNAQGSIHRASFDYLIGKLDDLGLTPKTRPHLISLLELTEVKDKFTLYGTRYRRLISC
jgi:hypothetical protein